MQAPAPARRVLLACAALLLAVPAALARRGGGEPIRVGAVPSVTGPASFPGDPENETLRLHVNRINRAAG